MEVSIKYSYQNLNNVFYSDLNILYIFTLIITYV